MKFKPGQSGNPQGRPKDTRTASLRALLAPHAPELVAKAVQLARDGDTTALRLCLERILPPLKGKDTAVSIPAIADAQTLADKALAVIDAAAAGAITPTEAATLMQSLTGLSRVIETDELEKRIAALEENHRES